MRTFLMVCVTALGLQTSACGTSPEQEQIGNALMGTVEALEANDLKKLWTLTAPSARERLLSLHEKIRRAMESIDVIYPADEREKARASVGGDLVGDISTRGMDRGPRLLAAFIKPGELRLDQAARDGLRSSGARIDGRRARIQTAAGEVFTFQKTDLGWRSALVIDVLDQSPIFKKIEENIDAVLSSAEGKRRAWVESTDSTTPNGAFNVLREALSGDELDSKTVFTLLDAPARAVFKDVLETSRLIQARLQRGVPRVRRKALYERHGVAHLLRIETDHALFKSWSTSAKKGLPALPAGVPDRIEGAVHTDLVTLVTSTGGRVHLVREGDGYWHLRGHRATLETQLLAPLKAKLAAL